jgi:hypothetical protein
MVLMKWLLIFSVELISDRMTIIVRWVDDFLTNDNTQVLTV